MPEEQRVPRDNCTGEEGGEAEGEEEDEEQEQDQEEGKNERVKKMGCVIAATPRRMCALTARGQPRPCQRA